VFFFAEKRAKNQYDFKKSITFDSKFFKMKQFKFTLLLVLCFSMQIQAQNQSALVSHYKAFYAQMQQQGDIQGVINAMTHLVVLEPNVQRKDTLAALYMNEGKYVQALNLIGIEQLESDTNLATEVKAVSLKSLNEPKRALEHYEVLYKQKRTVSLAYELADLKIQTGDISGASLNITYGIANATEDMMKPYYETQTPYQVPALAGFLYLKAIAKYRENPETNHEASISILNEALELAPNFNMANLALDAIRAQKEAPKTE
jgi:tetratricopeptide (TPR) repeat protein